MLGRSGNGRGIAQCGQQNREARRPFIQMGTEVSGATGRLDSAKKTDPAHGIKDAGVNKIHVIARERNRGSGLAAKTILQKTAMLIVKLWNGRVRHQNSWSHSCRGRGKSVSNISQQQS